MLELNGSVGINGDNNIGDVKNVQAALNGLLALIPPTLPLKEDGSLGSRPRDSNTVAAIQLFQKNVTGLSNPDGRIDPNGRTHISLNAALADNKPSNSDALPDINGALDLDDDAFTRAARFLDCEVAAIKAVAEVESSGDGFLSSGAPKILFEAHIFSRETQHAYDDSHPSISSRRWDRSLYTGGEGEYPRLKSAMGLNRKAALRATSWGKFQIMGFNHQAAGHLSLEDFLEDMFESESKQLNAFIAFLKSNKLDRPLKTLDWATFAKGYNGVSYKENKYDTKLQTAYEKYARS